MNAFKLPGRFNMVRSIAAVVALAALGTSAPIVAAGDRQFELCGKGPRIDCVVDGDTFWIEHVKIRPTGFDAPEMGPPNCDGPAPGSVAARARLLTLLNSGRVVLEATGTDPYGRELARVTVDGADIAATMISEGLARPYVEGEQPWC